MNGVTGSVLQSLKHLSSRGHELLVIAPDAGNASREPHPAPDLYGASMAYLPSVRLPSYPDVRVVLARPGKIAAILREFGADVVHLASPFSLGWSGVRAAEALQIPSVAVYQTDVTAYAKKYGIPGGAPIVSAHLARLHRQATLTLAPSNASLEHLTELGVDRLRHWGRGVDADLFAPERRNEAWRNDIAHGRLIVGYVGRLAPEKQVEDLRVLHDLPGVRLVIVGDGPSRETLERTLPDAHFTGFLSGAALAEVTASFDVFVHPGEAETFCQTIQEAHASGVPVVATGNGGPLDLVQNSIDGWLYEPGNLTEMRNRVEDLLGDAAKRAAFSRAARVSVRNRSWSALCDQLQGYYEEARELRRVDTSLLARSALRPDLVRTRPLERQAPHGAETPTWQRYVALGDSITEGLGDTSRMPEGEFLGWAARLAILLSARNQESGLQFANLAVRSRRVEHLTEQVDRALNMQPDLVSVLMGANDLVLARVDIASAAARLDEQVHRLRSAGIDVLLGTPFLPRRRAARVVAGRFAEFNAEIRKIALRHDCLLLDIDTIPEIGDLDMWAEDRVHLMSSGHRILAYRAATVLGVPDAAELSRLEHSFHDETTQLPVIGEAAWFRTYALPWMWRRVRGRTAGDGLTSKHDDYVALSPAAVTTTKES